jgi:tetratricopeptide (TPR) repeat protein
LLTLRKGTYSSNTAYGCAISLRNELRAIEVDTLIDDKALKYYDKAEVEFGDKNYNKAAEYYQRALEYQADFYKANLYLADSYYFMGNYSEAIKKFKVCADRFPLFLEPKKYLVDAYTHEGLLDKALETAIETMLIYPDPSMAIKIEDLAYSFGSRMDVDWTPRLVEPNKITDVSIRLERTKENSKEEKKGPNNWDYYAGAKDEIEKNCNDNGIIAATTLREAVKYLEVESWEVMLAKSDAESFKDARMIREKGFLDCYVLISCFHDDFYAQYIHFVTHNRERVLEYYKTIIVAR